MTFVAGYQQILFLIVTFGANVGGTPVFRFDEGHSQIGRVANSMKVRGTGVGKCIMLKGIEVAKEHFPDIPILIHAQQYASGFYEKCGFEVSSEPFDEDGIPHVEMLLYHK